jgi:hypothetical protein
MRGPGDDGRGTEWHGVFQAEGRIEGSPKIASPDLPRMALFAYWATPRFIRRSRATVTAPARAIPRLARCLCQSPHDSRSVPRPSRLGHRGRWQYAFLHDETGHPRRLIEPHGRARAGCLSRRQRRAPIRAQSARRPINSSGRFSSRQDLGGG